MFRRWWDRRAGLAIVAASVAALIATALATVDVGGNRGALLLVEDTDGRTLSRISLGSGSGFALRYRNSLYGSLAEERFSVTADGRLRLVDLAADELAVLEEYYAVEGAVRNRSASELEWQARPASPVEVAELRVAATDLGRRTLLVPGEPELALWRLVDDRNPTVLLRAVGSS